MMSDSGAQGVIVVWLVGFALIGFRLLQERRRERARERQLRARMLRDFGMTEKDLI